ncbi:MAG: hypothetical protein J2P26_14635, partial [Nocardiopsaceae bacterium]|nr:hypothetical protein [Nocardiopsaceae bacterium]
PPPSPHPASRRDHHGEGTRMNDDTRTGEDAPVDVSSRVHPAIAVAHDAAVVVVILGLALIIALVVRPGSSPGQCTAPQQSARSSVPGH